MLKRLAKKTYRAIPFKPKMFKILRNVWNPSESVYRHLYFEGPFALTLPNGASMLVHHFGNQVENDLFWAGFGNGWEKASLLTWLWLVKDADVVLDIGANTGIYALSAQATRPEAKIVAAEPVARIHAKLASNFELNRFAARPLNLAVSNHNGTVSLYDPGGDHAYSASLNSNMLGTTEGAVEVAARCLDDLAADESLPKIDVMKIDVEMHEPEVIAGARSRIASDRPAILVEILDRAIGKAVADQLPDYAFFEITDRIGPTDEPGVNPDRNYLALPLGDARIGRIGEGIDLQKLRDWLK